VNERLCIEEVGVDLELCVHAHGPDVEPIMKAARKNNSPLVQVHLVSVNCSLAIMIPTMIVFFDPLLADKLKHLSSANQCACPISILNYLEHYPPYNLEDIILLYYDL
jgi:homogentisate 1,2-dioxygenase